MVALCDEAQRRERLAHVAAGDGEEVVAGVVLSQQPQRLLLGDETGAGDPDGGDVERGRAPAPGVHDRGQTEDGEGEQHGG